MSTYSSRLKFELMATGANANTWGTRTNNNLDTEKTIKSKKGKNKKSKKGKKKK